MSQPTMPQAINLTQAWVKTNPNVKALIDSVSRLSCLFYCPRTCIYRTYEKS